MSTVQNLRRNLCQTRLFVHQAWSYVATLLWAVFSPKAALALRLLAAESQLAAYRLRLQQQQEPKPRFTPAFRLLWVVLSKLWNQWDWAAQLMQPATVKRWHGSALRFYRRWKSRPPSGRPPISNELMALFRRLSGENPLWSAERIRDTLKLLGYRRLVRIRSVNTWSSPEDRAASRQLGFPFCVIISGSPGPSTFAPSRRSILTSSMSSWSSTMAVGG